MIRLLLLFPLLLALLAGCISDNPVDPDRPTSVWMAYTMRQCLSNPWERDWLSRDGNEYDDYPRDIAEQTEIAHDYYHHQEIEILYAKIFKTAPCACLACSCCSGYTLWLKVPSEFEDILIDMGFRNEFPPLH